MKKMNNKGFTLIEMLVVIAIIAVLVSIIVPVVGKSTIKATAATNAANLRSVAASVQAAMLANNNEVPTPDGTTGVMTFKDGTKVTLPKGKEMSVDGVVVAKNEIPTVKLIEDQVVVAFKDANIENLAIVAETGAYKTTPAGGGEGEGEGEGK